jgi:WD40 repeat protein
MAAYTAKLTHKTAEISICSLLVATSLAGAPSNALIAKLDCPDRVNGVAYSPDGQLLAAGYGWNDQGGVKIWNARDRSVVRTWVAKKTEKWPEGVNKVAFSPDGRLLAAATRAGDVLVWKVGTWGEPKRIILKAGSPTALVFSPDSRLLAVSSEFAVFLCDLKTLDSRKLSARTGPPQEFIAGGFSEDGTQLAVCRQAAIQWWDVATGRTDKSWEIRGLGFFCGLSRKRRYLLNGGGAVYRDKNVELLNALDGKSLARVSEIRSGLFTSAISHSERWIALGGGNYGSGGDLSLWSLEDFSEIAFTSAGEFPVMDLAFSPDDSELAAGSHDGAVFLYSVEQLRGPERTKQEYQLCGEVIGEDNKLFIVPVAKVPTPMRKEFSNAWRLEVAEPNTLANFAGYAVTFQDWEIESNAAMDRARVSKFTALSSQPITGSKSAEYVVFGDVQNPGWDKGFVVKAYAEGSFVAANNSGKCLAYGKLSNLDFATLKDRLVREGLLDVPRDPLTRGLDHYRTRFIALSYGGDFQVRSDAEVVDFSKPRTHPTKKEEEFTRIFNQEQEFIDSLLQAGMHFVP